MTPETEIENSETLPKPLERWAVARSREYKARLVFLAFDPEGRTIWTEQVEEAHWATESQWARDEARRFRDAFPISNLALWPGRRIESWDTMTRGEKVFVVFVVGSCGFVTLWTAVHLLQFLWTLLLHLVRWVLAP